MTITCDVCRKATLTVSVASTSGVDERAIPRVTRLLAMASGWACEAKVHRGADVSSDVCPRCRP